MLMSMSVGPFCDLSMDVNSTGWQQGAVVSLKLDENEREFDRQGISENINDPSS